MHADFFFRDIERQVATGKSPQLRNADVQQDRRCCPQQASQITSILHVLQEEGGKPSPDPWANVVAWALRHARPEEADVWPSSTVGCKKHAVQDPVARPQRHGAAE